jgi:hypothetical protein
MDLKRCWVLLISLLRVFGHWIFGRELIGWHLSSEEAARSNWQKVIDHKTTRQWGTTKNLKQFLLVLHSLRWKDPLSSSSMLIKLILHGRSSYQDVSPYCTTHVEHACNDSLQCHGDSKKAVKWGQKIRAISVWVKWVTFFSQKVARSNLQKR